MKIIENNKIALKTLEKCLARPEIFTKGTAKFWDDDHISGQMLRLHLNPDIEAASKTAATITAETAFIIDTTAMNGGKTVLDLGCGPGLYVKEFARTGAKVTGIDLSARSVRHAAETVGPEYPDTTFVNMNYLDLAYRETFDIATLIFYDFGALDPGEQRRLLARVHAALKDNGVFVFDVMSRNWKNPLGSGVAIHQSGFWRPDPYIEILTAFSYDDPRTEARQYAIIGERGDTEVIRIYIRLFGLEEIIRLLADHNFTVEKIFKNLKGDPLDERAETYAIFARKA
ncbi:class I SAM-dependent methyltransferase [Anaeroselena agilis]|uniref:Class I SAM-dependent methyltransferase n=1 Tax=Anaeroselena agilis TaxID=3063788 RepID=A0ABU3NZY1_9FIRM|nr:class I SAM-dependent methyltransferase [Selenomonadales bacterium 4137-cl]